MKVYWYRQDNQIVLSEIKKVNVEGSIEMSPEFYDQYNMIAKQWALIQATLNAKAFFSRGNEDID